MACFSLFNKLLMHIDYKELNEILFYAKESNACKLLIPLLHWVFFYQSWLTAGTSNCHCSQISCLFFSLSMLHSHIQLTKHMILVHSFQYFYSSPLEANNHTKSSYPQSSPIFFFGKGFTLWSLQVYFVAMGYSTSLVL